MVEQRMYSYLLVCHLIFTIFEVCYCIYCKYNDGKNCNNCVAIRLISTVIINHISWHLSVIDNIYFLCSCVTVGEKLFSMAS